MKEIEWRADRVYPQGKNDSEIYRLNWAKWLDGETLVNPPTITAPAGITAQLYAMDASAVHLRVFGGTAGQTYTITVRVVSATHARVDERDFLFQILDQ